MRSIGRRRWEAAHSPEITPTATHRYLDELDILLQSPETSTLAFQALLASLTRALEQVQLQLQQAHKAALSLAQRETLHEMNRVLQAVIQRMRQALTAPGQYLLQLNDTAASLAHEPSWWFALAEALEVIETTLQRTLSLVQGQPHRSLSRQLGAVLLRLLRRYQHHLLWEAREWIE
ncbi:hypothetical protein [Rhodothermus bifroesti]|uniref:Uncharacterized protein n=2 Tax=Rhodothermus TaxID=29548 RepID=A0A7V2F6N9_RHOMR|nr:hypothetical protein [Rhodothermus bifroesti]GBD00333.1 hypothetical protein HRbin18_00039 [bacterium HR18]